MPQTNRQVRLAARPSGLPRPADWEFTTEPVPAPEAGQFVVEVSHLSIDPAMRGWMNAGASYVPPVEIGAVMRAGGIGRVTASEHPGFAVGDYVYGTFGVQEYGVSDGRGVLKLDLSLAEPTAYLGVLGMTGLTAYFGLLEVGKAREGDTVVVSGAAGAVGSVAGQIAKIKGCQVIGIAGGQEKCRLVTEEFGFDECIDYRLPHLRRTLRELAPGGVNVYFDNVGGEILDDVLTCVARGARIAICGAISQYNETQVRGPANYMMLLVARASMTGFLVFDYASRYPEAMAELAGWYRAGRIVSRETLVTGSVDDFPGTLLKLFEGANTGKLILALLGHRGAVHQVEPAEQGLDDRHGAAGVGGAVGDHVGVEEALADPDDREGQRPGIQAGVERAAAAFEVDEVLQRFGHPLVHRAAGAGQDAQRGLRVGFQEQPHRAVGSDGAQDAADHRGEPVGPGQCGGGFYLIG
jgi:NADPH-dependent curcumin reductase